MRFAGQVEKNLPGIVWHACQTEIVLVMATSQRNGAVAQLGERRDGIAKVWGSIPHGSTILIPRS